MSLRFSEYTIKEILCWLNINEPDCRNKVCIMNRILRDFYTHITGTKLAKIAVHFDWAWVKTIQFPHWVKQIHDFIVKWNCVSPKCFRKLENCGNWSCEWLYQMFMQEVWSTPVSGQYYINKDTSWTVITANIPSWVTEGWVVYSIWPEKLISIDDIIDIDDNALILFEQLIMKTFAEKNKEVNMAQYHENQFNKLLAKEIENQERLPYNIIGLHQNI